MTYILKKTKHRPVYTIFREVKLETAQRSVRIPLVVYTNKGMANRGMERLARLEG